MNPLTHFDEQGASRMVDTSDKPETLREDHELRGDRRGRLLETPRELLHLRLGAGQGLTAIAMHPHLDELADLILGRRDEPFEQLGLRLHDRRELVGGAHSRAVGSSASSVMRAARPRGSTA